MPLFLSQTDCVICFAVCFQVCSLLTCSLPCILWCSVTPDTAKRTTYCQRSSLPPPYTHMFCIYNRVLSYHATTCVCTHSHPLSLSPLSLSFSWLVFCDPGGHIVAHSQAMHQSRDHRRVLWRGRQFGAVRAHVLTRYRHRYKSDAFGVFETQRGCVWRGR